MRLPKKQNSGLRSVTASPAQGADCVVCGNRGRGTCARCFKTWYCSIECQRQDWLSQHHRSCAPSRVGAQPLKPVGRIAAEELARRAPRRLPEGSEERFASIARACASFAETVEQTQARLLERESQTVILTRTDGPAADSTGVHHARSSDQSSLRDSASIASDRVETVARHEVEEKSAEVADDGKKDQKEIAAADFAKRVAGLLQEQRAVVNEATKEKNAKKAAQEAAVEKIRRSAKAAEQEAAKQIAKWQRGIGKEPEELAKKLGDTHSVVREKASEDQAVKAARSSLEETAERRDAEVRTTSAKKVADSTVDDSVARKANKNLEEQRVAEIRTLQLRPQAARRIAAEAELRRRWQIKIEKEPEELTEEAVNIQSVVEAKASEGKTAEVVRNASAEAEECGDAEIRRPSTKKVTEDIANDQVARSFVEETEEKRVTAIRAGASTDVVARRIAAEAELRRSWQRGLDTEAEELRKKSCEMQAAANMEVAEDTSGDIRQKTAKATRQNRDVEVRATSEKKVVEVTQKVSAERARREEEMKSYLEDEAVMKTWQREMAKRAAELNIAAVDTRAKAEQEVVQRSLERDRASEEMTAVATKVVQVASAKDSDKFAREGEEDLKKSCRAEAATKHSGANDESCEITDFATKAPEIGERLFSRMEAEHEKALAEDTAVEAARKAAQERSKKRTAFEEQLKGKIAAKAEEQRVARLLAAEAKAVASRTSETTSAARMKAPADQHLSSDGRTAESLQEEAELKAPPFIWISGATGPCTNDVNGIYVLTGTHRGRPSWQKRDDRKMWLIWMAEKGHWYVTSSELKHANISLGFAQGRDGALPTSVASWKVFDEREGWQDSPILAREATTIRVMSVDNSRLLCYVNGPRAWTVDKAQVNVIQCRNGSQIWIGPISWSRHSGPFAGSCKRACGAAAYQWQVGDVLTVPVSCKPALELVTHSVLPTSGRGSMKSSESALMHQQQPEEEPSVEAVANIPSQAAVESWKKHFDAITSSCVPWDEEPDDVSELLQLCEMDSGRRCELASHGNEPVLVTAPHCITLLRDGDCHHQIEDYTAALASSLAKEFSGTSLMWTANEQRRTELLWTLGKRDVALLDPRNRDPNYLSTAELHDNYWFQQMQSCVSSWKTQRQAILHVDLHGCKDPPSTPSHITVGIGAMTNQATQNGDTAQMKQLEIFGQALEEKLVMVLAKLQLKPYAETLVRVMRSDMSGSHVKFTGAWPANSLRHTQTQQSVSFCGVTHAVQIEMSRALRRALLQPGRIGELHRALVAAWDMVAEIPRITELSLRAESRLLRIQQRQEELPGWTRICHSNQVADGGKPLVWDVPMDRVRELADRATRVRIQQRSDPSIHVTSLPDSYPIIDIRRGCPIGYEKYVSAHDAAETWCGPRDLISEKLWHSSIHWNRPENYRLESKIYHCAGNPGGIHWDMYQCGWTCHETTDLELYIDVE